MFYESASVMFPQHCRINSKIHFYVSQELEREITFQDGSGLYYYYYKHMLTAPSFERGGVPGFCFSLKKDTFLNM